MAIHKMTEQVQTSTPLSTDNTTFALKRPFKVDAAAVTIAMVGVPFLAHAIQGNLLAGGICVVLWIIAVLIIKVWHWIQEKRTSQ